MSVMSVEEFQCFWEDEPIVVLDANSILDLYRYSSSTTEFAIGNLEKIECIWIPSQVLSEYNKNKEDVRKTAFNKYKNVSSEVDRIMKKASKELTTQFNRYSKFKFPQVNDLRNQIDSKINELINHANNFKEAVKEEVENNKNLLQEDKVLKFIEQLIRDNKIGPSLTTAEKLKLFSDGELRYKYKIPPGYMDEVKDKYDETKREKFGDLIIWKEILNKSNVVNRPFVFITDDDKEDWWELDNDSVPIGPRIELIEEFREYSQYKERDFVMLNLTKFINYVSVINNMQSHSSYIEMNVDDISMDFIRNNDWELILNAGNLTSYLIHSGDLAEYVDEILSDIEVEDARLPILTSLIVDIEENNVVIQGKFQCMVDVVLDEQFSKHYTEHKRALVTIDGSIMFEFKIDFEKQDDFIIDESLVITTDDFEIIDCEYYDNNDDYDDDSRCKDCGKPNSMFYTNNGEAICEKCINHYDICPQCGCLFERDSLYGALCHNCEYSIED